MSSCIYTLYINVVYKYAFYILFQRCTAWITGNVYLLTIMPIPCEHARRCIIHFTKQFPPSLCWWLQWTNTQQDLCLKLRSGVTSLVLFDGALRKLARYLKNKQSKEIYTYNLHSFLKSLAFRGLVLM